MTSNCNRRWYPRLRSLSWRTWFGAALGGLLEFSVAWASPLIDASVAGFYVGQEVTVEASVASARREGNLVRLQLGQPPHTLQVTLIEGLLQRFPADAEHFYPGKTIRVSGVVREFRDSWEMIVRDPANLAVVAPNQPPADVPLRENEPERLRTLEERVQPLERKPADSKSVPTAAGQSAPAPGAGEDAQSLRLRDFEERLRKLEIRVRRIEQSRERR